MAKSKTPAKRARQSEMRRKNNMSQKSAMKTVLTKFELAIADKNMTEAENQLVLASSKMDKTAAKGIIHKNKVARKKSQLARKLNSLIKAQDL